MCGCLQQVRNEAEQLPITKMVNQTISMRPHSRKTCSCVGEGSRNNMFGGGGG